MAADNYWDPSQQDAPDWQDQIRQQVMAQQQPDQPSPVASPDPAPSTPSPDFATPAAPAPAAASPTFIGPVSDSGGSLNLTPGYTPPPAPAIGANGSVSVPRPSVDASVVYTDTQGNAYDPGALLAQWVSNPAFRNDPMNARVGDILAQYGLNGTGAGSTSSAVRGATGAGGTAAAPAMGGAVSIPGTNPWQDSIRKIIMSRLAQDQQPVDENSPEIRAALSASRDAYARQNDTERTALAERLYAQKGGGGLNTDAIGQQIQQSNERTGTAQSQLRAQILMSAYKDKFTELNHLLDLATSTGDAELARQVQVTLANLQAAVQREGLGVNLAEFGAQLNQNAVLGGLNG